jgi:hypothetical protein
MNKIAKKILTTLLAVGIVATTFTATTFAANTTETISPELALL